LNIQKKLSNLSPIPPEITSLPQKFVSGCSKLESIEIPQSVKNISELCFENCSSLLSVKFYGQIDKIGFECFSGCSKLESIEFYKSVTNISELCFSNCSFLLSVKLHGHIDKIRFGYFLIVPSL
jgi:hypothetical protein